MPKRNLEQDLIVIPGIVPASTALASVYSKAIDTRGYSEALIIVNCGLAAASAELDVQVRQGRPAQSVASQRMVSTNHLHIAGTSFVQMTAANDNTAYAGRLNLEGVSRYISLWFKRDGTNDVTAGAVVVLGGKQYAPTTQHNTLAFSVNL